jgi:hypothetical protein
VTNNQGSSGPIRRPGEPTENAAGRKDDPKGTQRAPERETANCATRGPPEPRHWVRSPIAAWNARFPVASGLSQSTWQRQVNQLGSVETGRDDIRKDKVRKSRKWHTFAS